MKKIALVWITFGICSSIQAQTKVDLNLILHDGNIMSGTSEFKEFILKSNYGTLNIPLKQVSSVSFGLKIDEANKSKIKNYLNDFKANSESVRQNAYDKIMEFGISALPILQEYLDANTNLVEAEDYSPSKLFSELSVAANGLENMTEFDWVDFDESYKMGGNLNIQKIDLKTEYGNLSIPISKIKTADISVIESNSGDNIYKLQANKHISGNASFGWLKTGIRLKSGQKISVSSSGSITLASLSNGVYTPDGLKTEDSSVNSEVGTVVEQSSEGVVAPPVVNDTYSDAAYPTYGQVVYKIGEAGESLKAGKKATIKVNKSGMLYLSIYETVFNAGNKGSYNVKVKVLN